jgi:hypothetical protein
MRAPEPRPESHQTYASEDQPTSKSACANEFVAAIQTPGDFLLLGDEFRRSQRGNMSMVWSKYSIALVNPSSVR